MVSNLITDFLEVAPKFCDITSLLDPYPHYFEKTFAPTLIRETNSLRELNFSIQNYKTHSYSLLCGYATMTSLHYMATLSSPI
jgi:hypothetical protein